MFNHYSNKVTQAFAAQNMHGIKNISITAVAPSGGITIYNNAEPYDPMYANEVQSALSDGDDAILPVNHSTVSVIALSQGNILNKNNNNTLNVGKCL